MIHKRHRRTDGQTDVIAKPRFALWCMAR